MIRPSDLNALRRLANGKRGEGRYTRAAVGWNDVIALVDTIDELQRRIDAGKSVIANWPFGTQLRGADIRKALDGEEVPDPPRPWAIEAIERKKKLRDLP